MEDQEFRLYDFSEIRVEPFPHFVGAEGEAQSPPPAKRLVGYAARFDTYSEDLGGFREIIRRGAFRDNLGNRPVFALANHNRDLILGSTKNGTLKVSEDQYGLRVELTPLDTPTAREWVSLVENGVIDKMSFAFKVDGQDGETWLHGDKGQRIRELHKVNVFDVSIVAQPAYEATSVAYRSLEEVRAYGESILARDQKERTQPQESKAAEPDPVMFATRRRHLRLLELSL